MFVESPDLISEVGRVSDPKIDVASLLQRLAQGWTAEHTSEPAAALRLLAHHWEVEPNESWISPNAAVANFPLNSIRLRNFGDLWVVLLGGASFDSSELASLKAKARGSSRQVMVLATSGEGGQLLVWTGGIQESTIVLSCDGAIAGFTSGERTSGRSIGFCTMT